jgi:hypothetical protein
MAPFEFKPSGLVHMGDREPLAAVARSTDTGFALVPIQSHYDGVYFYAVARDPLARGTEHTLIDRPAYRYGHPGFGWLGWIVSAGQPKLVPYALLAVALACAGIAGAAAAFLAADMGLSPWWGLVVALDPGLVYSETVLTSEAAALAALLISILAWGRGRRLAAAAALTAGCLIKEPLVLVPVGIGIYELIRWLRARRAGRTSLGSFLKSLPPLALGPLIYLGWYLYVWWHLGFPPTEQARDFAGVPFTGWLDTFDRAASFVGADFSSSQIGAIEIPLLVVVGFALAAAAVYALRCESEVQPVFVLLALTAFSLNWWVLLYPKDLLRALTAQLALLPFVFASPRLRRGPSSKERTAA